MLSSGGSRIVTEKSPADPCHTPIRGSLSTPSAIPFVLAAKLGVWYHILEEFINIMLELAKAIGYPEKIAEGLSVYAFRVDGWEIIAEKIGQRIVLKFYLDVAYDDLPLFASYAAGRLLREESVLAWDDKAQKAVLWREIPPHANTSAMKDAFEEFADSCEWWMQRVMDIRAPESVFPDMLIRP